MQSGLRSANSWSFSIIRPVPGFLAEPKKFLASAHGEIAYEQSNRRLLTTFANEKIKIKYKKKRRKMNVSEPCPGRFNVTAGSRARESARNERVIR